VKIVDFFVSRKKSKSVNSRSNRRYYLAGILILILAVIYLLLIKKDDVNTGKTEQGNEMNQLNALDFRKQGELTFISSENEFIVTVDIEIADDNSKRMSGLMFRDSMSERQGMLFIFPYEELQSFWMKNTVLSLDMIFVNSVNRIVKIHKNTTPFSEQSYPSNAPALYVVEVVAGFTDKFGIKEGDKISWRRI